MASCVLGLPNPLVESREKGIFRSFKINGVPSTSILAIPSLTAVFHALICSAIIAFTATPFFDAVPPQNWPMFILLTLLSALAFGGLGALIGVVSSSARAVVLWSQLIFLPSMLLGGLMMPLSILPPSVQRVAAILPSSHAMQAMEGLAYGREVLYDPFISVTILAAGTILSFALAIFLFSWDDTNNTRRGHPALALLAILPYLAAAIFL